MGRSQRTFVPLAKSTLEKDEDETKRAKPGKRRIFLHVLVWLVLLPVLLLLLIAVLLYLPPVQSLVRERAVGFLSEKTGADVQLQSLHLRMPLGLELSGLFVNDQSGDTLLYAGTVRTKVGLRALLSKRIVLDPVDLRDVRANLEQDADSVFNFDFILNAFASSDTTVEEVPADSTGGFDFSIGRVHLERIHFSMNMEAQEMALDLELGDLDLEFDRFVLEPMTFHVGDLLIEDTRIAMRSKQSPPEPPAYPALENPLDGFDIKFQGIELNNVRFSMLTTNTGDSLWLGVDKAELKAREMDLSQQMLALKTLELHGFHFGTLTLSEPTAIDTPLAQPPLWLDQADGFRFWVQDWNLVVDELQLANTIIGMHSQAIAPPALLFDPEHLVFTDLRLDAKDLVANNEHIALRLNDLTATAGPHATTFTLKVDLDGTPATISVENGRLTAMGNTIAYSAKASPGDLSRAYRAPGDVPIAAELKTELQMARLLPLLEQVGVDLPASAAVEERWLTHVSLEGSARRIEDLALSLKGDQGSIVTAQARASDVEDLLAGVFHLDVQDLEMGEGMRDVVRAFAPPNITLPRSLNGRATVNGNGGNIRSSLALNSDLGRISGSAAISGWNGSMPNGLDLSLALSEIQMGRIVGDTSLATMSFLLNAEAEGMQGKARRGQLTLKPSKLRYGGNDLSSLRLNADLQGDSIHAELVAAAEGADLVLRARGKWPEAEDSLAFAMDLKANELKLDQLGVTDYVLNVQAHIIAKAAFHTDGFGTLALNADSMRIYNTDHSAIFEQFNLTGLLSTDSIAVELNSDAITLAYRANMGVDSLMPRTTEKLKSFFMPDGTFTAVPGKRMDLALTLPKTAWLTDIAFPALEAIELKAFSGEYDSDTDELRVNIDVPHLSYSGIAVDELNVDVEAIKNRLQGTVSVLRAERDSLFIENLNLSARSANDSLYANLRINHEGKDRFDIGLSLSREEGSSVLYLRPQQILNNRDWQAHPDNALRFTDTGLEARNFELESGTEKVALQTSDQHYSVKLTQLRLSTFSQLVQTSDTTALLRGRATGLFTLPRAADARLSGELTISGLRAKGVPIGDLHMKADELRNDIYRAQVGLTDDKNQLEAKMDVDLSGEAAGLDGDVQLALQDLSFLEPFLSAYLFSLSGGLEGNLKINMKGDDLKVLGRTTFNEAGIGVIQTGSVYRFTKETIVFDERGVLLDNVTLRDSTGNKFDLGGRILTAKSNTPELDLRLRTQRFQLVNSTIEQNKLFYGKLFGSMDLRIDGSAISPRVSGDVGILEGTDLKIALPGSEVELIEHEGIVEFVSANDVLDSAAISKDSQMLRDSLLAQLPGVELDLNVKLDKEARLAIVIDPTTGDQATVRGEADLQFRFDPEGDMYLKGPFTVAEGGYTLEFYGLVKKRFELVPGGVIRWDGDPLNGRMDIQARYRSETAPLALVSNARGTVSEAESNRLQARLPFDVLINVKETVSAPEISFGLDLDRMTRNSYPQVNSRLNELAQAANEEELNRQVFGLLVLNTFIQDETGSGGPSTSLATSAARNSVNAMLTDQLNRATGKIAKGLDLQLGVNTYDQAQGNELYQRTTVDYKVSQRVLNDRITIEAGGSVGVDEREQNVSGVSNTRAAQYAIIYDLTKDGRLRLRAFHENAFDLYDGEIFNSGVAFTITREFEENTKDRERRRGAIRKREKATEVEENEP